MNIHKRALSIAVPLALTLLATACAGGGPVPSAPTPSPPPPPAPSPSPGPPTPAPAGPATRPPVTGIPNAPAAALVARAALARQLGLEVSAVAILRFEAVDWRDGCLEVETPGVMCTQVIVPGYRVLLEVAGKQHEFNTDLSGQTVVEAPQQQ